MSRFIGGNFSFADGQWWFVVHTKFVVQSCPFHWRLDVVTIDNLMEELVQLRLRRDDFIYYRSRLDMYDQVGMKMKMIELTDLNTVANMVEEYNSWQTVELHCYSKPDWFIEPAPVVAQHGAAVAKHGAFCC